MTMTMTRDLTTTPLPVPMPAPAAHILGPAVARDGEHVWHISVSHAGQRYSVRVAYDPRPGADPGTIDVAITPTAPLDIGTEVLRAAHAAAQDAEWESRGRWARLYLALAARLVIYQAVRDAAIEQWG